MACKGVTPGATQIPNIQCFQVVDINFIWQEILRDAVNFSGVLEDNGVANVLVYFAHSQLSSIVKEVVK